jgi:hypothetical protein
MREILCLIFFIQIISHAVAQVSVQATIIDGKTNLPIPYATIGIKGRSVGTIANERGEFILKIDESLANLDHSIIISSIGYENKSIPLADLNPHVQIISLKPLVKELKTVVIKPSKFKRKVCGRTGNSTLMTASMFTERSLINDNLGREHATIFDIDKECLVRDFNMYVVFNHFDSVKFRLNFYSVKDGQPDKLINNHDILFDVSEKKGWVTVNLIDYDIYLKGYNKVAVSIQWVKSTKTDSTSRSFNVSVLPTPLRSMFFRDKSQSEWKKISPANLAFNITTDNFTRRKSDSRSGDK